MVIAFNCSHFFLKILQNNELILQVYRSKWGGLWDVLFPNKQVHPHRKSLNVIRKKIKQNTNQGSLVMQLCSLSLKTLQQMV